MKKCLLNSKSFIITLVIMSLLIVNSAFGQKTWVPTTGGAWTTAGNWNPSGAPATGETVIINSNQSAAITAVPSISLASLTVSGNCNLVPSAAGNTLTVTGTFSVSSGISLSLGTNGSTRFNMTLGAACVGTVDGTLNVYSSGTSATFTNSGDLTIASTGFVADGGGGNNTNFTLSATGILKIASTAGISTTAGTGNIRVTGTRTYTAGSEVIYNGAAAQVTGNGIPTTSNITIDNAAGVTLNTAAALVNTGTLTMTNGTFDMANINLSVGGLVGTGNLTHSSGTAGARTFSVTGTTNPGAYSGIISNGTATSVSLAKSGSGVLTLSGLNTYTGTTTINAGTISINTLQNVSGGASSLGAPTTVANGTISLVAASSVLRYTGAGHSSNRVIATTTDGSTIDASGTGALTLTGGVTSGGGNDDLELTGTGIGVMNSVIATGSGALDKTGNGSWTFGAANTYTGTTTVSAGTLEYGINNAISTGAVTVNGGTLDIKTFTDAVGTVTLQGGGIITGTTGILTSTGSFAMQSGTVSAILAGTGIALTKTTSGTVTLSGVNTYTGVTSVNAGILSVSTIGNGGVAGNIGAATNAAANLVLGGGTLQYTGATSSTNRAFTLTTGTTSSVEITTGANTLTLAGAAAVTTGALTKIGAGTLQLSAANGYTGLTTVTEGTLLYGVANALSNGAVTVNGGTYDIATFNDAVGTVTLVSGTIAGTTGVLTGTSYAVQSGTASAILAGAVTLTKTTAGTVTLSGTNTYTGATTISAGTVIAANTQALGTIAGAVNLNGGILDLATDASMSAYNFVVGGSATIISNRATAGAGITHTLGTLSIGNFILSEAVGANVNSGTAGLIFGATTLSAATPRFDVAAGANLTLGVLSGNFAFTKQNSGQLNLNSASARTSGTVTLADGTMVLGSASALGTTGVALTLNSGTLDLAINTTVNAYNTTVNGTVTIASNRATSGTGITHTLGTLSIGAGDQLNVIAGSNVPSASAGLTFGATTISGATPVFDIAFDANLTLGALSGNNAFTKQGNGLMTLNSASARTGGTVTVNTGSIRLGSASAFGTATVPVVLNAGSGLNLAISTTVNAYNVTVNGNATIVSNRATSGAGITHTLGTLSIGNSTLFVLYGDNVNDATAGLTFGATTLSAATPVFDVSSGGVNLTLGALGGNFAFNKQGGGRLTLNTASARTTGTVSLLDGTMSLGAVNALGTTGVPLSISSGTLELATNTTVNAYNTAIGGDAIIISNRATAGAGITHVLGTLSIGANTLNINKGANSTSGTSAVQFGNLTMTGAPVFSPNTADLIMAGTATGSFKVTKNGAATLQKTTTAWTLGSDFEITAGTFDATTQNTTIMGDWLNNGGSHTASGASTVIFNGSGVQSIGGSSATTFNNLTIDNSSGVNLGNNETVNAVLTLTNGNLTIPTGNTLTIANGNAIAGSGFSASKGIVTQVNYSTGAKGFVRVNNMASSAAYVIPVSNGTYYLPVTLTPSDIAANNSFSVCSFPGITTNGEPNGTPFNSGQKDRCVDAVWTVNYNGPGSPTAASATMKVEWPASLEGINFQTYGDNIIGIAHWDGPNWGVVVGTGDNTANTATRSNITQFSPFAVGKIDPTGGVLAIKMIYFNASKGNGYNTLNWQAACSSSQAIFEIERSTDGVNFTTVSTITASQARCAQPFNYNDNTAPSGTVFYRIRIIDVDGKATNSAIVKLSSQVKDMQLEGLVPNPVVNVAQLKINSVKADVVELAIISLEGKVVYRNSAQLQAGTSVVSLDIANLPAGMYMIRGVFSDGQTNTVRFTKR